jgi:nitroreductase/FMN reductase [NAD(P)H]
MTTLKDLIARRFGIETGGGGAVPAEGALAAILGRGSQRHYTDKPVTDDLLAVLLACAQSAPTKSDLQQYSIVVVKDPAVREALVGLGSGMEWAPKAPAFLVFCADVRRIRRLAEIRGHTYQNDNLDTFMNGVVDAALAMQSFITAAESIGLGTCPISQIRNHAIQVSDVLGLPQHVFPVAGLGIGWPSFEGVMSPRLGLDVSIHRDRYDETGLREKVAAYDRRRNETQPYKTQRFVDKFGEDPAYGWAEDKARQYSVQERADFGAFVRARGFKLD